MSTTIDCSGVRAILAGEREEDLSVDESARFTAHLETCADCGSALTTAEAELEAMVSGVDFAGGAPPEHASLAWARVDATLREVVATYPPGADEPFPRPAVTAGGSTARRRAVALPVARERKVVPLPVARPAATTSVPLRYRLFGEGRGRPRGGLLVVAATAASVLLGWLLLREPPERPAGSPDYTVKTRELTDPNGKKFKVGVLVSNEKLLPGK